MKKLSIPSEVYEKHHKMKNDIDACSWIIHNIKESHAKSGDLTSNHLEQLDRTVKFICERIMDFESFLENNK